MPDKKHYLQKIKASDQFSLTPYNLVKKTPKEYP